MIGPQDRRRAKVDGRFCNARGVGHALDCFLHNSSARGIANLFSRNMVP